MANKITSQGHLLEFINTHAFAFIATEFKGIEGLSQPFCFCVNGFLQDPTLTTQDFLHQPAIVKLSDKIHCRYFHGYVSEMSIHAPDVRGLRRASLTLRPQLWYLSQTKNWRIFQEKSVVEIIKQCLRVQGISADFSGIKNSYEVIPFCMQYNESDFNFISRLLEHYGIYYYFHHDCNQHQLIFIDQVTRLPLFKEDVVYADHPKDSACVYQWKTTYKLTTTTFSTSAYNYLQPHADLTVKSATISQPAILGIRQLQKFSWSNDFLTRSQGELQVNNELTAAKCAAVKISGAGNYISFQPGMRFKLTGHEDSSQNGQYYLLEMKHQASDNSYLTKDQTPQVQNYQQEFVVLPIATEYFPLKRHKKPLLHGYLPAIVVGPHPHTIYTDNYGRIKVNFILNNHNNNSQAASAWLRVKQRVTYPNVSCHFLPRVEQIVTVGFMDGNMDNPVIIGSHFNSQHQPPYSLPEKQFISGIKTRTVGSKNSADANEIRFVDDHGQEKIYIQAQRDLKINIKNNETIHIGNNFHSYIKRNQTTQAEDTVTIQAAKNVIFRTEKGEIHISTNKINIHGVTIKMGEIEP